MFIDLEGARAVAISQVRSQWNKGKIGFVQLELIGGGEVEVPYPAWEYSLDATVTHSTPAPADTFLIKEDHGDDAVTLFTERIVAFVVNARGLVRAMTSQGIYDTDAVLFADGRVELFDRAPLPSLGAYAAELAEQTGKAVTV
jgi:hypothetical protein